MGFIGLWLAAGMGDLDELPLIIENRSGVIRQIKQQPRPQGETVTLTMTQLGIPAQVFQTILAGSLPRFIILKTTGKIVVVVAGQCTLVLQITPFIPELPVPARILKGTVFGRDRGNAHLF
ncbi:hypothetical protein Xbed_01161 [Xenorhabdus beddingii]|uniref:Uncharacterized protein n=1 Tax=Xenorhabdus beddingii TaxID=40578 RepID=A0A1Y2SPH0_9GAMM|nr:hypothetical protein Xbed_01161 [Xenorhabdus beddingii]